MSKLILKTTFLLIITFALLTSCKKEQTKSTVIRDCTGIYLRFNSKDWPVCNSDFIADLPDGKSINVTYKKVGNGNCADKGKPVCMMVHTYKLGELIEITKIK